MCQTALAEPVTIRVVQKDLLTTNREDVAHIQRIEQALARQGMTLRLKLLICHLLVIPTYLNVMLLSGTIPDLIYFHGSDQKNGRTGYSGRLASLDCAKPVT
ncbi:ABC transporter substrate-binding protein [Salmonella bongori]|nr:ABC transporter substrate-binding protein [Salmonella bongori]